MTNKIINLSKRIKKILEPFSKKIKIAGSIRRGDENPEDIDVVFDSEKF